MARVEFKRLFSAGCLCKVFASEHGLKYGIDDYLAIKYIGVGVLT